MICALFFFFVLICHIFGIAVLVMSVFFFVLRNIPEMADISSSFGVLQIN